MVGCLICKSSINWVKLIAYVLLDTDNSNIISIEHTKRTNFKLNLFLDPPFISNTYLEGSSIIIDFNECGSLFSLRFID